MILFLAASPSLDLTYEVDRLERGGVTRPRRVTAVPGGKALNAARVAMALGGAARLVAPLGGATGRRVAALLAEEGVGAWLVEVSGETRSCLAIVEDGDRPTSTDLYEASAPFVEGEWRALAEAIRAEAAEAAPRWLALSGSVPAGIPLGELGELLRELRAASGARLAVDSSGAPLAALAGLADLVKVNLGEAAELLGAAPADAAAACAALAERFGTDSVVTDGVRGAAALLGGVGFAVAAPRAAGRFPAGSGDAFFGALLAALDTGHGPEAALEAARDAAERNAAVPGQGRLG
ncbi:PfkB family carbohydrate kinase [Agromyces mediolanus]|uniref:PfkB family carbohydrate kinase n=1 Tax=Agromyces mediolanus TaxID=41986 RepID=UPI001E58B4A9|nr:PfkB family carbohydrate kinase [Agromyces mediolanus]MCD1570266.1 hypothetical protein [Agromyces mediolanus]